MFKVGDKVVCVDGYTSLCGSWTLETGKIYTVIGLEECKCSLCIDVGIRGSSSTMCYKCGHRNNSIVHYAKRFRKLDDSFATEVLERIKEEINQENLQEV